MKMAKLIGNSLILFASICLLQSLVPGTLADKNFVIKTCNSMDDIDLCSTILLSDRRSLNATSVADLAGIALDIAIKGAEFAFSHASDLSDQYASQPEEELLNLCKELWSDAVDDLTDAQTDVAQQNYMSATELANDAQDAADSCETTFADKGIKSLMSDVDKQVHDQAGLAADMLDMLDVL